MTKKLLNSEKLIKEKERIIPFDEEKWSDIPNKPGIYVIWEHKKNHKPVYVGETSSLKKRFNDLKHWRNHTFTRKIKTTKRFKSPDSIRSHISNNYYISFLPISYGRKETEEYLIHTWETFNGFNKKSPRYLESIK